MPNFFVPFATSPKMADDAYLGFLKNSATYPLAHETARLFRVIFYDDGKLCVAEVGKDITKWRGATKDDPVLAIVETTKLLFVHTRSRGGLSASPILVSPDEVVQRSYFDDYPALP